MNPIGEIWTHPSRRDNGMQKIRLLLLLPRLGGGGSQHVIALLANGLPREKFEVHLGLVAAAGMQSHSLLPQVKIHTLGAKRVRAGGLPLLHLIWQLKPDVILSGTAEVNFLTLLLRPFLPLRTRVLVRQNGTVSWALAHAAVPGYTHWLYRLLYPRADRVICQSRAMAEDLTRVLNISEKKIAVLPNPVDLRRIREGMEAPKTRMGLGPHLLAIGRLSQEKGFDLLLRSLVAVRDRFSTVDLIVAGEGQEMTSLKTLCRELYLQNAVSFVGQVERVYAFFPGTTLFVLPSRFEGMPNSLLEAVAAGLPIVTTPASEGIVDLLRGEPGAWLAPEITVESLAATLITALETIRPAERFARRFFPPLPAPADQTIDQLQNVVGR
jgi:glycosyltransferase involved in cell wall biosynthesis